jgi:hypothetical protein
MKRQAAKKSNDKRDISSFCNRDDNQNSKQHASEQFNGKANGSK